MQTSDEHVATKLGQILDRAETRTVDVAMFLGKSILLANGAALLACFTAAANGRICDLPAFSPILWIFSSGLVVGFAALSATYYGGLWVISNLARQVRYAAAIVNPDNNDEGRDAARIALSLEVQNFNRWGQVGPIAIQSLYATGALIFVAGIVAPLLKPSIFQALCSSALD